MVTEKNGVVILDKPEGLSSFLAVKIVKRSLGAKKAGHMGTLDPLASGVLVIGINKGTKLFDKFLKGDKKYYVEYAFGYQTDTLDCEGQVIKKNDVVVTLEQVKSIAESFIGEYAQMPPIYSAKKVNGKRACDLARQGIEVELKPKNVKLYSVENVTQLKQNIFSMEIKCSSGFYVRSFGKDIAEKLSTYCSTLKIRRTICCGFDISQAQTLEDIKNGNGRVVEIEN